MFIQLAIDLDILQQGVKQWGLNSAAWSSNAHRITLALPFSNANYLVVPSGSYDGASEFTGRSQYVTTQNSSSFTLSCGGYTRWIATGT